MAARVQLMSNFGKGAIRLGGALDAEDTKAKASNRELTNTERTFTIETTTKTMFSDAELKYRTALLEAKVFDKDDIPAALYIKKNDQQKNDKEETQMEAAIAEEGVCDGDGNNWMQVDAASSVKNTKEAVMKRLGLKEDAAQHIVGLRDLSFLTEASAEPAPGDASGSAAGQGLRTAILLRLADREGETDVIDAVIEYGNAEYTLDSDTLARADAPAEEGAMANYNL